jgi:predicted PurR-regulated permease PerM
MDFFNPTRLLKLVAASLKTFIDALSSSLLVFFIIIFMVLESTGFTFKLERQMMLNTRTLTQLDDFNRSIRSYMFITAWTGALTAGVDLIGLTILGVDLAGLWAVLFFLFNFIPAVGFLLAIIPPVLLALVEFGVTQAILVFFGCWLMDNIMDKVIKPRYMQQGLDLSPLVIILSIIFWSWVLGATGAILAIPLTLMLKKLVLENYKDTQNLALLLGSGINDNNLDN